MYNFWREREREREREKETKSMTEKCDRISVTLLKVKS